MSFAPAGGEGMAEPVIELSSLSKRYGAKLAVDRVDLTVPRGSVFGLLGPNGAGKTTTFGLVAGLLQPTSGSAAVLGTPSTELHRLRGRVAVLPQDAWFPALVPIRAQLAHYARLMGFSDSAAVAEAERVLTEVGLQESGSLKGSQLSHGMTKRIGIAAALIGNPEVLLLDEPTTGLDPRSAYHVKQLIARQAPRATVLLSSHQLADVEEICSHGAILDQGRLVRRGTMSELTRSGQDIWFELRLGAPLPRAELVEALGPAITVERPAPDRLKVTHPAGTDPAKVIATVLRVLLAHEVPLLGIQRGTSLETAFMQATGGTEWSGEAAP
jgi:ABC-type multidrug transport system ATPase subunit